MKYLEISCAQLKLITAIYLTSDYFSTPDVPGLQESSPSSGSSGEDSKLGPTFGAEGLEAQPLWPRAALAFARHLEQWNWSTYVHISKLNTNIILNRLKIKMNCQQHAVYQRSFQLCSKILHSTALRQFRCPVFGLAHQSGFLSLSWATRCNCESSWNSY